MTTETCILKFVFPVPPRHVSNKNSSEEIPDNMEPQAGYLSATVQEIINDVTIAVIITANVSAWRKTKCRFPFALTCSQRSSERCRLRKRQVWIVLNSLIIASEETCNSPLHVSQENNR